MGRDQMRNLETFNVGTSAVNEFEYQQNQGELTEQLEHQRDEQNPQQEATPTEAERIEKIVAEAHEKVEERKRRGKSSYSGGKSEAKKSTTKKSAARKSAARKSTAKKSAAKKAAAKKSTKKSAARKSSAKRSPARKSAAKKSAKKSVARKSPSKKTGGKKSSKARKR